MNITLPEAVARKLSKVPNKSAFIADAVVERLAVMEKDLLRKRLLADYAAAAKERDDERDAGADW